MSFILREKIHYVSFSPRIVSIFEVIESVIFSSISAARATILTSVTLLCPELVGGLLAIICRGIEILD